MLETTTAYGLDWLVPTADTGVSRALREFGEFARPEVELIAELVGGGAYVDVGANLGSIALPVAQAGGRVIAIEANRDLAGLLATNALNNRLYNVQVHHAAVGEVRRLAKFPMVPLSEVTNLGTSGFHLAGRYPEEVVQMTTLDAITPRDTTVIKIDVEGYENQVMIGAESVLRDIRPVWIVESGSDTPGNRVVMEMFLSAGYRLWWFLAPFVTRQTSRSGDPSMLTRGDFNILAMPDGREPPWMMPEVADRSPRPVGLKHYPYLARFGF
ncbi:MAG: FkbM family methyltransferase [Phenylobacterium sp.]|uniref:FkbM family methyltransferase n=1 Tax=Phenylobacterium sp. TaxID=1871053 RepID=UPI0027212E09|nr:FkbM family methyltransferase [Phenylobacterium sp.]MDO8913505.1 FkbM family methyltransferase [Phenylobacterium sp.]MDP3102598.1 FkbM family methyltransferase [Phenylobacterium sp.]